MLKFFYFTSGCISYSVLNDLKYGFDVLYHIDGHIRNVFVIQVYVRILLSSSTARFLRLDLQFVGPLAVLEKLGVSMEALITIWLGAFVQLGLRVSSMVFSSVAAGRKCSVTELALKGSLSSMHSFVHLKIGLVEEFFATYSFLSYLIKTE